VLTDVQRRLVETANPGTMQPGARHEGTATGHQH
jgi:hypothetical protein